MNKQLTSLKIDIPEGYRIDKENSTFEEIVFEKIEKESVERWKDLDIIEGYFISSNAKVEDAGDCDTTMVNCNVFPTQGDAESSRALAMLLQLRKADIGKYQPDWKDTQTKYVICRNFNDIQIQSCTSIYYELSFPTREMASAFARRHEYLLGTYFQL